MDLWDSLSKNQKGGRTEILHNIDPIEETWALRVDNMKLLYGKSGSTYAWSKWFQVPTGNDSSLIHDISPKGEAKE